MAEFTNVLVTDTFDQWRIKTNNIGEDVTALIGTVETDLDAFRLEIGTTISDFEDDLAITLANLNTTYVTLASAQTISGAKTFTADASFSGGSTLFVTNDVDDPLIIRRNASAAADGTFIPIEGTAQSDGVQETQITTDDAGLTFNCINDETFATVGFVLDARDTERATNKGQAKKKGAFYITNWGTDGIELHAGTGSANDIRLNGNNIFNSTGISTTKLTVNNGKMKLNNLDYTWPSERVGNRYLKTDVNGGLSWAAVAGGTGDVNLSTLVFNDIVPVGTIIPWAGTSLPADEKWKFCNGEQFSQATYPELWAVLGGSSPKYGSSGGNSLLPNLNGRVPVGTGTASGFNAGAVGTTGGSSTASGSFSGNTGGTTLTAAQSGLPSHSHTYTLEDPLGRDSTQGSGNGDSTFNIANTGSTGGTDASDSHSHSLSVSVSTSTIQPYLTTQYIIKVLPDDVQQVSIAAGDGINFKDAESQDSTTLDLFSTKIELLTNVDHFIFNNGRLELKNPDVRGPAGADGADGVSATYSYNSLTKTLTITSA